MYMCKRKKLNEAVSKKIALNYPRDREMQQSLLTIVCTIFIRMNMPFNSADSLTSKCILNLFHPDS